ncbi:response regulator [Paenibacillus turpanensis]|uniref:response regulator n=1 Tax=Paenibacillus turpanensis TaxID=2689078 RepID=UPI0014077EBE|nr:response regulator [Paenibacillus turpanensis]
MIQVLIAEDDSRIGLINQKFVEKVPGYRVVGIAGDCQDAIHFLEIDPKPELVLLDIQFPDGTGFDILQYIHEHCPDTDVIAITAAKEVRTIREAMHKGVFDYIVKPVIFSRLEETLERYKEYRKRLSLMESSGQLLDQQEIDSLRGSPEPNRSQGWLPKGIDRMTLDKVSALMEQRSEITAEDLGQSIGISRSTARRYLEYMVSEGRLRADLSYGTVGRPERIYRRAAR